MRECRVGCVLSVFEEGFDVVGEERAAVEKGQGPVVGGFVVYGFHEIFGKAGGHERVEGATMAGLDVGRCTFGEGSERLGFNS